MDWVDSKSLCIATSSGIKHELLELLLPDKMIAEDEQGKLKKDRDFRVNAGGFCRSWVTELKHIPDTRLCVLSDEEKNGISLWQIGTSDTDLMQEVTRIPSKRHNSFPVRISVANTDEGNRVAFGSSSDGISIVDVETCQIVRNTNIGSGKQEPISAVGYRDKDTILCCTCSGDVNCLDLRSKEVKATEYSCRGHIASFWTMSNINNQSNELFLLSSNGEVLLEDLRCLDESVKRIQTSLSTRFDGNIYIYRSNGSDIKETTEPLFQHEGHVMNQEHLSDSLLVVKHLWHPCQQDLVMSAATDGSLHAWQYQLEAS